MRQFANYIHIAPAFRVSSISNNAPVMKSGFTMDRFATRNEVEPTEEVSKNAAGPLYSIKVMAAVDKLTDAQKEIYAHNAPVVLQLMDVETVDKLIIGSPSSPAVVSFIPGTQNDQLVIEYQSKVPVL